MVGKDLLCEARMKEGLPPPPMLAPADPLEHPACPAGASLAQSRWNALLPPCCLVHPRALPRPTLWMEAAFENLLSLCDGCLQSKLALSSCLSGVPYLSE